MRDEDDTSTPNAQQIEYWHEVSGPKWVSLSDTINSQIEPIGREAILRAKISPGEQVLDVGCGCGQTSLELAARVGRAGRVLGIDISGPMLDDARARASREGEPQLDFVRADAQVHGFAEGEFNVAFSRFGVMFFDDPVSAFRNLHSALRPDGRLCFVCWQPIQRNPWMLVPAQAAAQHVTLPAPADPNGPGPFAFGDPDRVRDILGQAGFSSVDCEDFAGDLRVGAGRSLDDTIEFLQQMGPAGAALRDASEELRAKASDAMRTALEPSYDGDALVMGFAAWIVTARA